MNNNRASTLRRAIAAWLLAPLTILVACSSPPKSSTLTLDDLEATTNAMASQMAQSTFLAERGPDSQPIIVAISKVENLTSDIIPESQKWWMMARVRDQLNVSALRESRNIRFVIPRQFLLEGMERGNLDATAGIERAPTHEMSATFRSATRSAGYDRADAYLCEYRVTQIGAGALVWSGEYAFKRTAFGRAYD